MKMIKHASLFKWPQNGASKMTNEASMVADNGGGGPNPNSAAGKANSSSSKQSPGGTAKQKLWLHPPATLQNGHIAYLVKYFGNVEVNQPKGIEVVKESINKLKFIQPLKKSEGNRIPKVELTISVNGVAIQEPKTKKIYCQFPLHRISYCADDKTEKKFFSFIAKDVDTDKHLCFVFMSEKRAEEIILTIGQAFDLAYAKFIETSGRELEVRKQHIILQKKVKDLEDENRRLKERLGKYEPLQQVNGGGRDGGIRSDSGSGHPTTSVIDLDLQQLTSPTSVNEPAAAATTNGHSKSTTLNSVPVPPLQPPPSSSKNRSSQQVNLIDVDIECADSTATLINANDNHGSHTNSNSVKNLINDLFDEDFDPRAAETTRKQILDGGLGPPPALPVPSSPPLQPPPPLPPATASAKLATAAAAAAANSPTDNSNSNNNMAASISQEKDIFGCEPFQVQQDPFGMPQFSVGDLDSAIVTIDKKIAEMRDGFSQGLSADGFNLDT